MRFILICRVASSITRTVQPTKDGAVFTLLHGKISINEYAYVYAERSRKAAASETRYVDDGDDDLIHHAEEMPPTKRKEVYNREDFRKFFDWSSKVVERVLSTNERYNPLVNYAQEESNEGDLKEKGEMASLKLTFYDEKITRHRAVTDVQWSPKVCVFRHHHHHHTAF